MVRSELGAGYREPVPFFAGEEPGSAREASSFFDAVFVTEVYKDKQKFVRKLTLCVCLCILAWIIACAQKIPLP